MDIFIEALKENKEMDMIDELYKDTIELYSKKKIAFWLLYFWKYMKIKVYVKNSWIYLEKWTKTQKIKEKIMTENHF